MPETGVDFLQKSGVLVKTILALGLLIKTPSNPYGVWVGFCWGYLGVFLGFLLAVVSVVVVFFSGELAQAVLNGEYAVAVAVINVDRAWQDEFDKVK